MADSRSSNTHGGSSRGDGGKKATSGVTNVQRRTWDRDEFERKAAERAERDASGESLLDNKAAVRGSRERRRLAGTLLNGCRDAAGDHHRLTESDPSTLAPLLTQPFRAAPPGSRGPDGSDRAFLRGRQEELGLDAKLGKRRLVTEATPVSQTGGYWCEVCQCTLRDSVTWLDHINGKNHQKRLGFSMRVERSTVDSVKDRFAKLKKGGGVTAAPGGSGKQRTVLDADDRYALAAMDHSSIQVANSSRWKDMAGSALSSSSSSRGDGADGSDAPNDDRGKRQRLDVDAFGRTGRSDSNRGAAAATSAAASSLDSDAMRTVTTTSSGSSGSSLPSSAAAPLPTSAAVTSLPSSVKSAGGEDEEIDPDMAAMMGFSGFGSSKR